MGKNVIKKCKNCDQRLRIPTNIGGMLMCCPSCGHELYTDFRLEPIGPKGGGRGQDAPQDVHLKRPSGGFKITV